jgi:hypothetical protein
MNYTTTGAAATDWMHRPQPLVKSLFLFGIGDFFKAQLYFPDCFV